MRLQLPASPCAAWSSPSGLIVMLAAAEKRHQHEQPRHRSKHIQVTARKGLSARPACQTHAHPNPRRNQIPTP